ncbi:hypothetical protein ES707_04847 [subsurface metagenome]
MVYIGVDGCRKGWFAVVLKGEANWKVKDFPDISSMWNHCSDADLILIDMPIGLRDRDSKERACDIKARKLLGAKRGSSVFPSPCRAAIYADTYEDVNAINKLMTGRRLPRQTWGIIPKIREVDKLLSREMLARSRIREIHPEVCFWALNRGKPMKYSKKKEEGFLERMEVLLFVYPSAKKVVDYALQEYLRREVARDDILDAMVAAVTSSKARQGLLTVPENPEVDSKGLPMEMVYYPTP